MYYTVFDDEITLSQLIRELQSIEAEYGESKVLSIGSCSGQIKKMNCPFSITMVTKNSERKRAYIATKNNDAGKSVVVDD